MCKAEIQILSREEKKMKEVEDGKIRIYIRKEFKSNDILELRMMATRYGYDKESRHQ
jgi:hypothetical protein